MEAVQSLKWHEFIDYLAWPGQAAAGCVQRLWFDIRDQGKRQKAPEGMHQCSFLIVKQPLGITLTVHPYAFCPSCPLYN